MMKLPYKYLKNKIINNKSYVKERSNVIQFDDMGYPLRLIINNEGNQVWIDTYEEEDDIILEWKKEIKKWLH